MGDFFSQANEFLAGNYARSVYWAFAIAGTAVFAFTGLLHIFGIGGAGEMAPDVDTDMDGNIDVSHPDTGFGDFKLFSLRAVLAFITMFGWGGVVFGEYGWSGFAGALLCGAAMMVLTALLIAGILKLRQSGNVSAQEIVGRNGTVYLTIPGGETASGKVNVNLGDATREIRAFASESIATGTFVRVVRHLGGSDYIVEKTAK